MAKSKKAGASKRKQSAFDKKIGLNFDQRLIANATQRVAKTNEGLRQLVKENSPLKEFEGCWIFNSFKADTNLVKLVLGHKTFGPIVKADADAYIAAREGRQVAKAAKKAERAAAQEAKRFKRSNKPKKEVISLNGKRYREI